MKKRSLMMVVLVFALSFTMACALLGGADDADTVDTTDTETQLEEQQAPMGEDESEAEPADDMSEDDTSMEESSDDMIAEEEADSESADIAVTSGACYNEYFPIVQDRVLVYETNSTDVEDWDTQYELTYRDVSNDSFATAMRFYGVNADGTENINEIFEAEIHWTCSEAGLLQEESTALLFSGLEEDVEIEYETVEYEGITFPIEDNFEIGSTWDSNYVIRMSATVEGQTVSSEAEITQTSTAVAFEPVSVPYGDFDEAVRVESITEMKITSIDEAGNSFTFTTTQDLIAWYVKGIGMVKQEETTEGYTTTQMLIEIR